MYLPVQNTHTKKQSLFPPTAEILVGQDLPILEICGSLPYLAHKDLPHCFTGVSVAIQMVNFCTKSMVDIFFARYIFAAIPDDKFLSSGGLGQWEPLLHLYLKTWLILCAVISRWKFGTGCGLTHNSWIILWKDIINLTQNTFMHRVHCMKCWRQKSV